jgi:hypothetical protein
MAQFQIDIPDELLPALVAEFSLVQGSTAAASPEEYFAASVIETVRQRAEIYRVGPYYAGPVNPQFRQDGKPYGYVEPAPEGDGDAGPEVIEPPADMEPEAEIDAEPVLDVNDTTEPDGGDV